MFWLVPPATAGGEFFPAACSGDNATEAIAHVPKIPASVIVKSAKMPKEIEDEGDGRVQQAQKNSSHVAGVFRGRNYLDWMVSVPWHKCTKDDLNVDHVKNILDTDHYGLDKPKERILEHIAVLNLVKEMRGQILCFVRATRAASRSMNWRLRSSRPLSTTTTSRLPSGIPAGISDKSAAAAGSFRPDGSGSCPVGATPRCRAPPPARGQFADRQTTGDVRKPPLPAGARAGQTHYRK